MGSLEKLISRVATSKRLLLNCMGGLTTNGLMGRSPAVNYAPYSIMYNRFNHFNMHVLFYKCLPLVYCCMFNKVTPHSLPHHHYNKVLFQGSSVGRDNSFPAVGIPLPGIPSMGRIHISPWTNIPPPPHVGVGLGSRLTAYTQTTSPRFGYTLNYSCPEG